LVENFKYITYFVIVLEYPEIIEKVCRLTETTKKLSLLTRLDVCIIGGVGGKNKIKNTPISGVS
jgi:hypothetical protein